jgi:hypothetical protein
MFLGIGLPLTAFGTKGGVADTPDLGGISSGAMMLLAGDDGLALDFIDDTWFTDTGFYGSAAIVGGGTQDGYDTSPTTAASSLLTYTSPSVKMCMGPSGTLRYGAHNLCNYSDAVNDATWTKDRCTTPAAGSIIEDGTAADTHRALSPSVTLVSGATYTVSVEAKPNGRNWLSLGVTNIGNCTAFFNVSTGVVGTVGAAITSTSIEASTDGYYKCSVSFTSTTTSVNVILGLASADNTSVYNGDSASGLLVRKTHTRRTPSDSTYLSTTTAARYALPYQYASGVCEGILVEEARTNNVLRSQEFDNASWSKTLISITANQIAAPDGTTTADLYTASTTGTGRFLFQSVSRTSAAYTDSVYVKKGTAGFFYLAPHDGATTYNTYFNLNTGAVATNAAGNTATITALSNGWYRVSVTRTIDRSFFVCGFSDADNSETVTAGATGYVWGAQLEAGSFATTYIQTFASTVTRAADQITLATSLFPWSATTNTIYVKYRPGNVSAESRAIQLDDGTANEAIQLGNTSGAAGYVQVVDGGANQTSPLTSGTVSTSAFERLAVNLAANDIRLVSDGGAQVTDATATLPTVTTLRLGGGLSAAGMINGYIEELLSLPRTSTQAQLQGYGT